MCVHGSGEFCRGLRTLTQGVSEVELGGGIQRLGDLKALQQFFEAFCWIWNWIWNSLRFLGCHR
jgi:hypothetical protein